MQGSVIFVLLCIFPPETTRGYGSKKHFVHYLTPRNRTRRSVELSNNPGYCHRGELDKMPRRGFVLQPMMPPNKRFDMFPPCWGMQEA